MANTLDNNKQIISSNTFQGGLVTLFPPHLLSDGATPDCQNIDFSRSFGRATKRRGTALTVTGPGVGASGLYEFILAAGTTYIYESAQEIIYEMTAPSTRTVRYINSTDIKTVGSIVAIVGPSVQVTVTAHGFLLGDTIKFFGQNPDNYGVAGNSYVISGITADTFVLNGLTPLAVLPDTTGYCCKSTTTLNFGETNFTTFDNLCLAVSPTASTLKTTGTSGFFTLLLGTPPANAKYIESHKGRVFIANHSGGKSRVSWCYLDNPEDWTTITGAATDAGYLDVGLDDGDIITGIKSVGSVMLIFKNNSTWLLSGSDPTDFKVRKLSGSIGCVGPRSIVACDSFAIFLSNTGVYSANSEGVVLLSYNIKPTAEGWTSTMKRTSCAGRLNTQYWLGIQDTTTSQNNTVYVLDYTLGVWGRYSALNPHVFYTKQDGTLISASGNSDVTYTGTGNGNVYTHDSGSADSGSAIDAYWDTPEYDFGDWAKVKHPLDAVIAAKSISAKTITLSHYVDGVVSGTTLSFSLTPSGSKDKAFFLKRSFPSTSYGRFFKFRFRNAEASADIELYAFSIRAAIDERQQG